MIKPHGLRLSLSLTRPGQELAEKLTKKIRKGLEKIRKSLRSKSSLPHDFSGIAPAELRTVPQQTCSSDASYDDILRSFLQDGSEYRRNGDASRLFAWCSNFNAGSIDSIVDYLPPRGVQSSQAREEHRQKQDAHRQARKRRRDLARLVNSIVYGLPGEPRIVYIALGVEKYQFSRQGPLSDTQYGLIASIVIENLKEENWPVLKEQRVYNPAHDISERAQLELDLISKALKDVSTLGKPTEDVDDIDTSPPLTSGSDCSNSTLLQQFATPSTQCSTLSSQTSTSIAIHDISNRCSETTPVDKANEVLATASQGV
ncbi:hypothetical protein UCRPC4_g01940 [Phaeomoniella chlamydospora]|uniref:Uncharacterized protein n=1 Tax=Phaeomoniella chlamydospora TaxID=158046 RepID=A0A0G2ET05_PHACM|nr:hypothetical protein UCRPC4_g01940 [Phaeomoniella chlamydospora]